MIGSKYNTVNRAIYLFLCKDRALTPIVIVCPVSDIMLVFISGMVFKDMFNNISIIFCQSVLLVVEIGVLGENHLPVASILSEEYLSLVYHVELTRETLGF